MSNNDYQFLNNKLENFKKFIKEISRNQSVIKEYENMSIVKLTMFATMFLIPNKNNLELVITGMREKLDFDAQHDEKLKKYLTMFIEFISGELQSEGNSCEEFEAQSAEEPKDLEKKDGDPYLERLNKLNV